MSDLQARINTLRQQAGTRLPANAEVSGLPQVPSLKQNATDTLARWLQKRRLQAQSNASSGLLAAASGALPGREIAPGLLFHEQSFPALTPMPVFQTRFRPQGQFATRDLLYFDTETTGLNGGTGTRAFMIGCADWHEGMLRVRQLLCTRLAAEPVMLSEFLRWLAPNTVLVSYNGRSFDVPLLKSRLRLAQLPDRLTELTHLDLVYPVRRLYRGRWANCRLGTIENHVLRFVREDDLPGSEAPQAWLNFLRFGASAALVRVIDHNTQDLHSLHGLLWHLIRIDEEAFELRN